LERVDMLEEPALPDLGRGQVEVEIGSRAVEVARDLSVRNGLGFLGVGGEDRRVVDWVDTVCGDPEGTVFESLLALGDSRGIGVKGSGVDTVKYRTDDVSNDVGPSNRSVPFRPSK
jgi:hypothetical protein